MCRILLKTGRVDLEKFGEALALMKNGGPDFTGIDQKGKLISTLTGDVNDTITFGHNRLKIRDLSPSGDQPMRKNQWGTLLYNGEIYNQEAQGKKVGYAPNVFKGDTEFLYNEIVRLNSVGQAVSNFNMEGALAWIESDLSRIKIYRDSRGTKTLYWYISPTGELGISSEIKPLLALFPGIEPYKPAVKEFLHWGYNPGAITVFTGIYRLRPAERISFSRDEDGSWEVSKTDFIPQRYFNNPGGFRQINQSMSPTVMDTPTAIKITQEFLNEAVKRRLISDVPISCTLSGGLDSSIMAYLMKKHHGPFFKTYTLDFKEDSESEGDKAQKVADWLGVKNERITISSKNILAGLDDIIRSVEEPCDKGSLIPTYFLSRGIEEKVSLIGEGSDELFLGYDRYKKMLQDNLDGRDLSISEIFKKYYDCVPPGVTIRKTLDERRLIDTGIRNIFGQTVRVTPGAIAFVDRNTEVPNYHCVRIDKMFMRFGHEARLPYLDEVLINKVRTIDPGLHIDPEHDKKILREAFRGEIPDWILDQPKKALKIPYDQYVQMPEFKKIIYKDYLRVISKEELDALYKTYETGQEVRNRGRFLWLLVLLNKWYEQFYGNGKR